MKKGLIIFLVIVLGVLAFLLFTNDMLLFNVFISNEDKIYENLCTATEEAPKSEYYDLKISFDSEDDTLDIISNLKLIRNNEEYIAEFDVSNKDEKIYYHIEGTYVNGVDTGADIYVTYDKGKETERKVKCFTNINFNTILNLIYENDAYSSTQSGVSKSKGNMIFSDETLSETVFKDTLTKTNAKFSFIPFFYGATYVFDNEADDTTFSYTINNKSEFVTIKAEYGNDVYLTSVNSLDKEFSIDHFSDTEKSKYTLVVLLTD